MKKTNKHSSCLSKFPLCKDVKQIKDRQKVILQDGTKKKKKKWNPPAVVVLLQLHTHGGGIDYEAHILWVIESTLLVGHFLVQAPGMKTHVSNGLWHGALQRLQPVLKSGE